MKAGEYSVNYSTDYDIVVSETVIPEKGFLYKLIQFISELIRKLINLFTFN